MFIQLFIYLYIHLFTCPLFIHSCIHTFVCSFVCMFSDLTVHIHIHSFSHLLNIHSFIIYSQVFFFSSCLFSHSVSLYFISYRYIDLHESIPSNFKNLWYFQVILQKLRKYGMVSVHLAPDPERAPV